MRRPGRNTPAIATHCQSEAREDAQQETQEEPQPGVLNNLTLEEAALRGVKRRQYLSSHGAESKEW
eukprot:9106882-Pyramimonas_sp.AAC.1